MAKINYYSPNLEIPNMVLTFASLMDGQSLSLLFIRLEIELPAEWLQPNY